MNSLSKKKNLIRQQQLIKMHYLQGEDNQEEMVSH